MWGAAVTKLGHGANAYALPNRCPFDETPVVFYPTEGVIVTAAL